MRLTIRFQLTALATGLLLIGAGCNRPAEVEAGAATESPAPGQASAGKTRVVAGPPQRKTISLSTTQPGRILPFEEAPLAPRVPGYIEQVNVDIGDVVEHDAVLLTISVPELRDELRQMEALVAQAAADVARAEAGVGAATAAAKTAEAQVAQAEAGRARTEAEFQLAQSEYARIRQLVENGSVTEKLLDEATNRRQSAAAARDEVTAEIDSAKAMHAETLANIKKAEADAVAAVARRTVAEANQARTTTMLAFAEIKAPFAGVVTRRTVDIGHYVAPATSRSAEPLLVVTRSDKVRVAVDVPELEAPLVNAGEMADTALIRVQALNVPQFSGTVSRTGWSLDGTNRSLRVEVDLPNDEGLLRPGMFANVTILLDTATDALVIPATAVIREDQKAYCAKIVGGKIERVPVELGLRSGAEIVVRGGLSESDTIVLVRPELLKPGDAVEAITPAK